VAARLLAVMLALVIAFGTGALPSGATHGASNVTAGSASAGTLSGDRPERPTRPARPTDVPADSVSEDALSGERPERPTRPARPTDVPVDATEVPVEATATEVPVEATATEVPVQATATTAVQATSTPVRATDTPVRATSTPVRATATPVRATSTPRATVAATATQRPTTGGGSSACPTGEELVMLALINDFRAENGVGPLTLSPTLTAAADFHSQDMANRNYFSHDLPGIGTWSQNISNYGYGGGTRAENIAAGYSDAARTVDGWINSPGHRTNMLNPNLHAIGIASAYNANSQYGTYWTNDFGGTVDSAMSC